MACIAAHACATAFAATLPPTSPAAATAAPAEVVVERAFMPDAAPSSFAITFPGGVSVCYDPIRGGVDYAWQGGFDVTPARPGLGKLIKPVKPLGEIRYRENGPAPLRRADAARAPVVVFKGYRLHDDAVEFVYTIDGVLVREELRARPAGDGLSRRFRTERGDTDTRWWYVPGPTEGGVLTSPTGQFDGGAFRFDPNAAREFTLEVVFPRP